MEEALRREIIEETNLSIYDIKFFWHQEFIFDPVYWKHKHFIFLDFVCKTNSTKVKLNSEGQSYTWVLPKEALKLPIEPYTKQTIKEYLKLKKMEVK